MLVEAEGEAMKTSTDRILTTHTGSLPRPPALRELLVAKDKGEPYDAAALARLTREAGFAIVRRQAEAGIDVINDGEMSKPGYSTYVADRLTGFAGNEPAKPRLDTGPHPNFVAAYARMTGERRPPRGLRRPDRGPRPAADARRSRQFARRAGAGECGRGLYDRGL